MEKIGTIKAPAPPLPSIKEPKGANVTKKMAKAPAVTKRTPVKK